MGINGLQANVASEIATFYFVCKLAMNVVENGKIRRQIHHKKIHHFVTPGPARPGITSERNNSNSYFQFCIQTFNNNNGHAILKKSIPVLSIGIKSLSEKRVSIIIDIITQISHFFTRKNLFLFNLNSFFE